MRVCDLAKELITAHSGQQDRAAQKLIQRFFS